MTEVKYDGHLYEMTSVECLNLPKYPLPLVGRPITCGQRDLIRPVGAPSPRRRGEGTTSPTVPSPTKLEKVDRAKPETDEVPLTATSESLALVGEAETSIQKAVGMSL